MPQPLPPGWERVLDPGSRQYYYYNARLGVTQWNPPDIGSVHSVATFTTVKTIRKAKPNSRRQPVTYADPSPRLVITETECNCGDWIFIVTLFGTVAIIIALALAFETGKGTYIGANNRNAYKNYQYHASQKSLSPDLKPVTSGCVQGYDDIATTAQCGILASVLKLVNEHRASLNDPEVKPLRANPKLNTAAQRHACWMAESTIMSHAGGPADEDREFVDRVEKTGYQYVALAENVAAGQKTASDVVSSWLNSPGHRRNIENRNYVEIGLGLGETDEGLKIYWCQVFGKSRQESQMSSQACRATAIVDETNPNTSSAKSTGDIPPILLCVFWMALYRLY